MKNEEWMKNFRLTEPPSWDETEELEPRTYTKKRDQHITLDARKRHELMMEKSELEYATSDGWENNHDNH